MLPEMASITELNLRISMRSFARLKRLVAITTMASFELSLEQHGRASIFHALVRLRHLAAQYPGASLPELQGIARAVSSDYAAAEWTVAHRVAPVFEDLELHEDPPSMRRFLDRLLVH